MARKKKQVEFETAYVDKIVKMQELYQERVAFLATFSLPKFGLEAVVEQLQNGSGGEGADGETVEGGYEGGDANIGSAFDGIINAAGKKHGINPYFIASIIKQESNFDPKAGSHAGARGLMQLMPATAASLGVTDSTNPEQNVEGGVTYIKQMLESQGWDPILALAAYNAGPGNVRKHGGVPPFKETQDYVKKIPANFKAYTGEELTKNNVRWSGAMTSKSNATGDAKKVLDIATSWLKKDNRYVFGGGRSMSDIKAGRFDCSSWCRYIFEQVGKDIMNNGNALWGNTDTAMKNKNMKTISTKDLKAGDLMYFDTYKVYGHITICMGDGKAIGTQGSTGVAIIDYINDSYWKSKISNQHKRVF